MYKTFFILMLFLISGCVFSSTSLELKKDKSSIEKVVEANNQFAFDIYSKLPKSKNLFYSPYSISSALAIVYEGARGKTAEEIKSVFHFPKKSILRPNFAKIADEINEKNSNNILKTVNALWIQKDYKVQKEYLNLVEKYYKGRVENLDFINESEKSREIINSFIEKETYEKIKNLIPRGMITPATRLVITNAIYFKGLWKWRFKKENTKDMNFYITPKRIVKTKMMHMEPKKARFNYADLKDLQILELPYKGEKISMMIILPKRDTKSIEPLTSTKVREWKMQMRKTKLDAIYLPKFKFKTKYFLRKTLKDLGMPTAFSPMADFSNITGKKDLHISEVIHQAYIDVNEKGTEAAAATAVVMRMTMVPIRYIFKANHPFIFIIEDKKSGNILFLGRVVNPLD